MSKAEGRPLRYYRLEWRDVRGRTGTFSFCHINLELACEYATTCCAQNGFEMAGLKFIGTEEPESDCGFFREVA